MKEQLPSYAKTWLLLPLLLVLAIVSRAQVTICTTHPITNNANNSVLFNVQNTNSFAIQVTSVSAMINTGGAGTYGWQLLYNPTPVNSTGSTWTQGVVGAGLNGWVSGGTATLSMPAHTAPIPVISGMTITIPANTTYGFALTLTSTSSSLLMDYSALTTPGVNTFSSGGVNLLTGDNISWGAAMLPTTPLNYPRGFRGCITWTSTVTCSGTPDPATASAPSGVCLGASFNLSASGYSTGAGITYQWQYFNTLTTTWDDLVGATTPNYAVAGGITAATDYRLVTTCSNGGLTDVSNTVTVGINSFYNCYCSSNATSTSNAEIFNVTVAGVSNSSTCTTIAPGPGTIQNEYSNYSTTLPPIPVAQGQTVPFSVQIGSCSGNAGNWTEVYIDVDRNGLYTDPGDLMYSSLSATTGAHLETGTFTIPATAGVGITGMRIVNVETTTATGVNPCGTYTYGETEDYLVEIFPATACSGIPVPGVASGPASVCENADFALNLAGYPVASGTTIQWESSPAGANTWTPVGTNTAMLTVTGGITAATDFRAVVTCSNGGFTDVSNTVTVTTKPFYICYCGPQTGVTLNNFIINYVLNVTIPNTTLNHTSITTTGYSQFYPTTTTTTADLIQGQQYTLNITHYAAGYYSGAWIDFDASGTMDAGEFITVTATGTAATGTFVVPLTAVTGLTGLRIRHYFSAFTSGMACTPNSDYETEDYVVNIVAAPTCAGIPTPGTLAGPASVCSGIPFTMSLSGYTAAQGITFSWESSPAGANTWTPLGLSTPSVTTVSQTAATDYRVSVTCTNGGFQDYSNTITVGMSPFYICYCSPLTGVALNGTNSFNYITNVSIPTTPLNNPSSIGGYSQFYPTNVNTTADLSQGVQYTINTTHIYSGAPYTSFAWIDYDANGSFDASEYIPLTTTALNGSATFTVPLTATPGLTGLRVRHIFGTIAAGDACSVNGSYETEDYVVNILATAPCAGTPVPGIVSGPANACTGVAFNLMLSGYTIGTGITIDWESSPAGVNTWTSMGQTTPIATGITQSASTDYRATVTCNGTSSAVSNVFTVSQNPPGQCYCTPIYTTGCTSLDDIHTFTLTGENSTAFNDLNTGCSPNAYDDRTGQPAVELAQGLTYNGTINSQYTGNEHVRIWVDFGDDGVFDATDEIGLISNFGTAIVNYTVTIPLTGTLGTHRMRARMAYNTTASTIDPCTSYTFGETHDYMVQIVTNPLSISLLSIEAVNAGNRNRVSWTTGGEETGDYFVLQRSIDGSDYVNLATINAKGLPSRYTYWDEQPVTGTNHYRLQMFDVSGSFRHSKVVTADVKSGAFIVEAHPNPVSDVLTVKVYGAAGANASVAIMDLTGKIVSTVAVGNNEVKLNMSQLAQGSYLVKYSDNDNTQIIKVNKH